MSFWLTNAPITLMRLMDGILKLFLDYFVILFFDDIIVYSKNMEEHASQLHIVLGILREK